MNNSQNPRITLSIKSLDDMIEAMPMLMGYVPDERAVLSVTHAGRIVCTGAASLADLSHNGAHFGAQMAQQALADAGVLVIYSQNPEQWVSQAQDVVAELEAVGVAASAALATSTAWAELDLSTLEVGPWSPRIQNSPVVMEAVVAGLPTPAATREAAVANMQANPEHCTALAASPRQEFNGVAISEAVRSIADGTEAIAPEAVRSIAAALMDRQAWSEWFEGQDIQSASAELPVWCALASYYADQQGDVRTELEGERVLTACGFVGWLAGNGVVVVEVLERLDRRDRAGLVTSPDVQLERAMVLCANDLALSPSQWLNRK